MTTIVTDRLVLTPIGPEHTADLVQLHADPNVAYWNAGAWSPAEALRFATAMRDRWSHDHVGKWIAHRRSDGALVGRGGLSLAVVDGTYGPELGWALRDSMRGHGFATLNYAEIVAFTEAHNRASRAVMERLGMEFARIIRAPGLIEGHEGVHDDAPFALYRMSRPEARSTASDR